MTHYSDEMIRAKLLAGGKRSANGCLLWPVSPKSDGYGSIYVGGDQSKPVHRVAYALLVGPIPEGYVVDHDCHTKDATCIGWDNCQHRACFEPTHLVAVTQAENMRRAHHGVKGAKTPRTAPVSVVLSDEPSKALDEIAEREERSRSWLISKAVDEYIARDRKTRKTNN